MYKFFCGNFRLQNCHKISSLVTVYIGNHWQWRKQTIVCSAKRCQLSDTASRLAEVLGEVSITALDWLANFSDYRITTKLQESYEVVKSAPKIR